MGDLDSASEGDLAWALAEGAEVLSFPTDKDLTDLELALQHVDSHEAIDHVVVFGVGGGRLDHEMGNWAVCGARHRAAVDVVTRRGNVRILRGDGRNEVVLSGEDGDVVSIIPRAGQAVGVTTNGLRWPLDDAVLYADASRGVSNQMNAATASVSLRTGVLFVVQPGSVGLADLISS